MSVFMDKHVSKLWTNMSGSQIIIHRSVARKVSGLRHVAKLKPEPSTLLKAYICYCMEYHILPVSENMLLCFWAVSKILCLPLLAAYRKICWMDIKTEFCLHVTDFWYSMIFFGVYKYGVLCVCSEHILANVDICTHAFGCDPVDQKSMPGTIIILYHYLWDRISQQGWMSKELQGLCLCLSTKCCANVSAWCTMPCILCGLWRS